MGTILVLDIGESLSEIIEPNPLQEYFTDCTALNFGLNAFPSLKQEKIQKSSCSLTALKAGSSSCFDLLILRFLSAKFLLQCVHQPNFNNHESLERKLAGPITS